VRAARRGGKAFGPRAAANGACRAANEARRAAGASPAASGRRGVPAEPDETSGAEAREEPGSAKGAGDETVTRPGS